MAELWYRILKPRARGARIRSKVVHEPLLIELNSIERGLKNLERVHVSRLADQRYIKLVIGRITKRRISRLNSMIREYNARLCTVERVTKGIFLECLLPGAPGRLWEAAETIIKNNASIGGYRNLHAFLSDKAREFVKRCLEEKAMNLDWFRQRYPHSCEDILKFAKEDDLDEFLRSIESMLKDEPALNDLKEIHNKVLQEIEVLKHQLRREREKLSTWYNFIYGYGCEETIEELKREQEKLKRTLEESLL